MSRFKLAALAFVALVGGCHAMQAQAQGCAPLVEVLGEAERNGHHPVFVAQSAHGPMLTIIARQDGRYVALAVMPDGMACLLDIGDSAVVTPLRAPQKGS
jgi:hypothetical protein